MHNIFKIIFTKLFVVRPGIMASQKTLVFFIHHIGASDCILYGHRKPYKTCRLLEFSLIDGSIFFVRDFSRCVRGRYVTLDLFASRYRSLSGRDSGLQVMLYKNIISIEHVSIQWAR